MLDNWGAQLDDIRDSEAAVRSDSEGYNSQQVRDRLQVLAGTAERQCEELQDIISAIQQQTSRQEEIQQDAGDRRCLKDLSVTDPRHDKARIQSTKGGLLEDSYCWILNHADFLSWLDDPQSRLLWIKGDPGKGKTMLLCGIIDELNKTTIETNQPAYFFCQATDERLNSATAVLRGLIYFLIDEEPPLISHVRTKYDKAGGSLFNDVNSWFALSQILTNMLSDPLLEHKVLIVDALDECVTDRQQLLDFISSSASLSRAKWIVSSRNWRAIEEIIDNAAQSVRLSLELNEASISAAVQIYILHKVEQLTTKKKYNSTTRDAVQHHLLSNANDTFLWVALVCQELADHKLRKRYTLDRLKSFPPGLDELYGRMMELMCDLDDADLCKQILATVSVAYRPVTLKELAVLVGTLEGYEDDLQLLEEDIGSCGSFLTLRDGFVYFAHQSAKDFLLSKASDSILPSGIAHQHCAIFSTSLKVLSRTLRHDIYELDAPGTLEGHGASATSVAFTADGRRLASASNDATVKVWDAATGAYLQTLEGHIGWVTSVAFTADGRRLASASNDKTVKIWDAATGAYLQTLKGHIGRVTSVAFTADGWRLASASDDKTVKIWDAATGACVQTLHVNPILRILSFDVTDISRLITDIGVLTLDPPHGADPPLPLIPQDEPTFSSYGIGSNGIWIVKDNQRMLWLPPEYRPSASSVTGSTIAIGCNSGQVLLMQFSREGLDV
ncbi:hypothetical protein ACHAQH_009277 [Verticillium albo-atrum]